VPVTEPIEHYMRTILLLIQHEVRTSNRRIESLGIDLETIAPLGLALKKGPSTEKKNEAVLTLTSISITCAFSLVSATSLAFTPSNPPML